MKTKILFIAVLCFSFLGSFSQTGSIKGKVIDKKAGITIPFASVYIEVGGQKSGVPTNADGEFHLKALPSGTYELHVTCMGYSEYVLSGVRVLPGRPTFLEDIPLSDASIVIGGPDGIVVRGTYVKKMIDPIDPIQKTLVVDEIENTAGNHNITDLLTTISPEIMVPDNGAGIIVRGSRSGSSQYFVDGVKISEGEPQVSVFAINSISVYTGGVPAPYGDITGGVIIIETKSYFDFIARENAKEKLKKEKEEM
jgi:hypothetical protein